MVSGVTVQRTENRRQMTNQNLQLKLPNSYSECTGGSSDSYYLTSHMKLHIVGTANRRISNIEPQNVEGWNRFALSFLKWTEFIYSTFDVGRSMFDVHLFLLRFDWTLAARRR